MYNMAYNICISNGFLKYIKNNFEGSFVQTIGFSSLVISLLLQVLGSPGTQCT